MSFFVTPKHYKHVIVQVQKSSSDYANTAIKTNEFYLGQIMDQICSKQVVPFRTDSHLELRQYKNNSIPSKKANFEITALFHHGKGQSAPISKLEFSWT